MEFLTDTSIYQSMSTRSTPFNKQSPTKLLLRSTQSSQSQSDKSKIRSLQLQVLQVLETDLQRARFLIQKCMRLSQQVYQLDNIQSVYIHYLYADVLTRCGDSYQAIGSAEIAVKLCQSLQDSRAIQYLQQSLFLLGLMYQATSQRGKSLHTWLKLLQLSEQYQFNLDILEVKLHLADCYLKTSRYTEAKKVYMDCLQLFPSEKVKFKILLQISVCEFQLRHTQKSLQRFLQTKSLLQFGSAQEKYKVLSTIAQIYISKDQFKQAISALMDTLQSLCQDNLEQTKQMSWVLTQFGKSLFALQQFQQAFTYFTSAKNLNEKLYGIKAPETAVVIQSMGNSKHQLKDLNSAINWYILARNTYRRALGKDDPATINSGLQVVFVHLQMGNTAAAWLELEGLSSVDTPRHVAALIQNEMGNIMRKTGFKQEALQFYRRALDLYISEKGEESPEVARVYLNLGSLCIEVGRLTQANISLVRSKRMKLELYGKDDKEMAGVYQEWGKLLEVQGNQYKAKKMFEKALKMSRKYNLKNQKELEDKLRDWPI